MNEVRLHEHNSLRGREAITTVGGLFSRIIPSFSPNLACCDFHRSGHLKAALRGRCFADDELRYSVREEPRRCGKESYVAGIQHLTQRWKACS
jgi:hypothetical protein